MSNRFGANIDWSTSCPHCEEPDLEYNISIGYPDRAAGITSLYLDYIEGPETCPNCGKALDLEAFGESALEGWPYDAR